MPADRDPAALARQLRAVGRSVAGEAVRWGVDFVRSVGAISPGTKAANRFGSFGQGSIICFPQEAFMNEASIHIGEHSMIGREVVLSAGWGPGHPNLPDRVVTIGDRCLIGRGSTITGHKSITIGDDVWTGHHVYITDMNHGYEDLNVTISRQFQAEEAVVVGDGSWLGNGVSVLPGSHIGRHVVVGAGSVVTGDLPDFSVAVGSPARVIRQYVEGEGWVRPATESVDEHADAD